MEDTIEICSGCGKMPRPVDRLEGYFVCSRCGNRSTIMVTGDDYERVAMELDQKFHEKLLRSKAAEVKEHEPEIFFSEEAPGDPGKKPEEPKATGKKKKATKKKPAKATKKKAARKTKKKKR